MEPFLGEIRLFPWNWAPRGWAKCDGSPLPIAQYQALYALVGTRYGAYTQTTFSLPDLRGRAMVGTSNTSTLQGNSGGLSTVTLTSAMLPPHTHSMGASQADADNANPAEAYPAKVAPKAAGGTTIPIYKNKGASDPVVAINAATVSVVGAGQAHSNLQPYLAMNYCIATAGLFPPRP